MVPHRQVSAVIPTWDLPTWSEGNEAEAAYPRGVLLRPPRHRSRAAWALAISCSSPTGAATPTSGSARTARRSPRCSAPPPARGAGQGAHLALALERAAVQRGGEPALRQKIEAAGGECLRDMRVRVGGSHHQKLVVLRHPAGPSWTSHTSAASTCATAAATTPRTRGDPQPVEITPKYGNRPPWHDVQLELRGPVVGGRGHVPGAVGGPGALVRNPLHWLQRQGRGRNLDADRLPPQLPDPPPAGDRTRAAAAHLPATGAAGTRSPRTASAASPAATARRSSGPGG